MFELECPDDRTGRSLPGLTAQETREFLELESTVPFDGMPVWPTTGLPAMPAEERWLELWHKQQRAHRSNGAPTRPPGPSFIRA